MDEADVSIEKDDAGNLIVDATPVTRCGRHRALCIQAVKKSDVYYQAVQRRVAMPVTPDPWQPMSKRTWEQKVRRWRMELKAPAADEPPHVPWPLLLASPPMSEPIHVGPQAARAALPGDPMYVQLPEEDEPQRQRLPGPGERRGRSRSPPCGPDEDCPPETWEKRSAHRLAGVKAIKRSSDYIAVATAGGPRPKTPNPTDRKLSKRAWERGVQQWRMDLKGAVANLPTAPGGSVIVIDDDVETSDEEEGAIAPPPTPTATRGRTRTSVPATIFQ